LRFFYVKTLKQPFILEDIPFQREPQQLPEILSQDEVARLLVTSYCPLNVPGFLMRRPGA